MVQRCRVTAHLGINGVDENAFDIDAFSIDAWEFFGSVIREVFLRLKRKGRR
jgi:hypothetical protein